MNGVSLKYQEASIVGLPTQRRRTGALNAQRYRVILVSLLPWPRVLYALGLNAETGNSASSCAG